MARPVDPIRHVRQRTVILRAAYLQFAEHGYEGTSTAAICRAAGVSSGTLFHYFPTKVAILLMLIGSSDETTEADLGTLDETTRGLEAVLGHLRAVEHRMATDHFAGFADAVRGAAHLPEIADARRTEAARIDVFLRAKLREAADAREIRIDVRADVLAQWLTWLVDGALQGALKGAHSPGGLIRAALSLLVTPHERDALVALEATPATSPAEGLSRSVR
ncbi:TetR/AcrR family transcriptional regulator [Plantibacter flavus]|uniref:TetR/AcrR family transcriptional regulator n=1 Tax=Plantibacter flavus TaxID=150123 RepID=UPI003F150CD8